MGEVAKFVYYGEYFYYASGTRLGSLYTEDGKRVDWGKIKIALRDGKEVVIRHATKDETTKLHAKLDDIVWNLPTDLE